MKQAHFILGLIMLIAFNLYSQQDNNWYFGRKAALNFSTGKPIAVTNSNMSTMEGSASISDMNGNMLFYTDGITVWNRNNQKMPHGEGLLGDQSTTQAAIIVPKPGSQTRYYIFTADDAGGVNGLNYSEVDMLADNGKGDVVNKNVQVITPVTEKIAASYHANGSDIWITTHQWGGDAFYSFKVTAQGVNTTPVISHVGLTIEGADNSGRYAGWMNLSPDGKKLASASGLFAIELFDFDNLTGKISNPIVVKTPAKCYGAEFSPNSELLYASSDGAILQYQVNAADVAATQTEVGAIEVASSIKLGPDSKIYVVTKYLYENLSVISKPDVIGTGCNFVENAIDLGGNQTYVGLPNFITSPYYVLDIDTQENCDDMVVHFEPVGTLDAEDVFWDFGDGNHSHSANATHTYSQPGTYTVRLKARRQTDIRFFSKQITVVDVPSAETPDDMYACTSEQGNAVFNLTEQNPAILSSQPAELFTINYYSTEQDAESGTNALSANYTNISNPQTVYARLERTSGSCYDITSFQLHTAESPVLDMEKNYSFCQNSYVVLTAPEGFDSYVWTFNGKSETGSYQKSVSKAGTYTLTVTKATGNMLCEVSKTITVTESQKPKIKTIEVTDWTDYNNSINVVMATQGNYGYSLDNENFQESPLFENLEPGEYTVYVKDLSGCGEAQGDAVLLMYPKFFTPNGDGIHDKWQVKHSWYVSGTVVTIFDRFGKILSSFKGNSSGWDGTFNGRELPASDYWFVVTKADGKEYKGHFSLLR